MSNYKEIKKIHILTGLKLSKIETNTSCTSIYNMDSGKSLGGYDLNKINFYTTCGQIFSLIGKKIKAEIFVSSSTLGKDNNKIFDDNFFNQELHVDYVENIEKKYNPLLERDFIVYSYNIMLKSKFNVGLIIKFTDVVEQDDNTTSYCFKQIRKNSTSQITCYYNDIPYKRGVMLAEFTLPVISKNALKQQGNKGNYRLVHTPKYKAWLSNAYSIMLQSGYKAITDISKLYDDIVSLDLEYHNGKVLCKGKTREYYKQSSTKDIHNVEESIFDFIQYSEKQGYGFFIQDDSQIKHHVTYQGKNTELECVTVRIYKLEKVNESFVK